MWHFSFANRCVIVEQMLYMAACVYFCVFFFGCCFDFYLQDVLRAFWIRYLGSLLMSQRACIYSLYISFNRNVHNVNTLETLVPWYGIKDHAIIISFKYYNLHLYRKVLLKTVSYNLNIVLSRPLMSETETIFAKTNVQLTSCTNCNRLMLIRFKLHISLCDPIILLITNSYCLPLRLFRTAF